MTTLWDRRNLHTSPYQERFSISLAKFAFGFIIKAMESTQTAYGTTADEFKPLSEILLSDVRQKYRSVIQGNGESRKFTLADLHKQMEGLRLNSSVPDEVQIAFDTARNLYVYSWFVYRFQMSAQLQAYAALEHALGKRIESEQIPCGRGLSNRMGVAIQRKWFKAEKIRVFQLAEKRRAAQDELNTALRAFVAAEEGLAHTPIPAKQDHATEYLKNLKKAMPGLRNTLAHGRPMLFSGALTIEICRDLINQLF